MHLGDFEPDAWVPATHPAAADGVISLEELTHLDVIHGPRRASPETYDSWLSALRTHNPRFEFTEPPFRWSLPMTLAYAASGSRPAAVLTGPIHHIGGGPAMPAHPHHQLSGHVEDMVPVRIRQRQLTATASLVWNGDLPRQLQQVLFDTADGIGPLASAA
jgi:hypothetical protein